MTIKRRIRSAQPKSTDRDKFFKLLNLAAKSADSTEAEREESQKRDYRNGKRTHPRKTEDASG